MPRDILDAHHHLWTYSEADYPWIPKGSPLHASFGPSELAAMARPHGVSGSIVVQARQSLDETDWLLEQVDASDIIEAAIGWAPLSEPDIGGTLDRLSTRHALRGIRHVVQDEPDGFLLADAFNRGIDQLTRVGLVYDILIYGRQLRETMTFVDRHPEQRFVLDHIAKPTIDPATFDTEWADAIRELARRENVWCKVSGMATEVRGDEWSPDTLRPYWDTAVEAFTPQRLMFGSDWPVALLKTDYGRWVETAASFAAELSESEQAAFFRGNAEIAYGLRDV